MKRKLKKMINNSKGDYLLYAVYLDSVNTNCYIFGSKKTKRVIVIDPGADAGKIKHLIAREGLMPECIVNTHGHIDHIGANHDLRLPVYIHERDANFLTNPLLSLAAFYGKLKGSPKASRILTDNDVIQISDINLRVIHTPGHTPGGISLYYDGIVFTGDTLFAQGIGRTDLPYGNSKDIENSIKEKLFILDESTLVFPGHGESTTIGSEKRSNPWL
jgi:hydroxyacylglutathione hydrolase